MGTPQTPAEFATLAEHLRDYSENVVTGDGRSMTVRTIRPDDKAALQMCHSRLSNRSRYFRFHGFHPDTLSDAELKQFTELDFIHNLAVVGVMIEKGDPQEHIVGVCRMNVYPNMKSADVAFCVVDTHQKKGIAPILLQRIINFSQQMGIEELEADVLGENNSALKIFQNCGMFVTKALEDGCFHLSFQPKISAKSTAVSLQHHIKSTAKSIKLLYQPKSIAIVGASRREGSVGNNVVKNLSSCNFNGSLFPINPNAEEILGLKCYGSLRDVPEQIDTVIIAVPAKHCMGVMEEIVFVGAKGVVVITSGFAETGSEGLKCQNRLVQMARTAGLRLVGPNCFGIVNTDPDVSMNATFVPRPPLAGNVGVVTQSGALGLAVIDYAARNMCGISSMASVGNNGDVSANDMLCFWRDDPRTKVVVLYIEGVGNPRNFARIAPEVSRIKPIVAVKSGRTAAAKRAASSHSASLAALDVAVDALFTQAGVIRTNSLGELFDVVQIFSTQPTPKGNRVGIITNAGGLGILLVDACETHGLVCPEVTAETKQALQKYLPAHAGFSNPIDMTAEVGPKQYEETIALVGADPNVDIVVAVHIPVAVDVSELGAAVGRGAARCPQEKPFAVVWTDSAGAPPQLHTEARGRLPCFDFPESAAIAMSQASRYGRWLGRSKGTAIELDETAVSAVRAVINRALEASMNHRTWLSPTDIACVLKAAGIEFAHQVSISGCDGDDVALACSELGFPLVFKAIAPGLVHKSDAGGVIMSIENEVQARKAARDIAKNIQNAGYALEGILLQREVKRGVESLVGVTTDPTWGPLVVVGLGGVLAEVVNDATFCLPPVTDTDASEMVTGLRSNVLLEGYRGAPPGDRKALEMTLQRISALVIACPELLEMDLNPIKVLEPGMGAVAVDARIRIGPVEVGTHIV